MNVNHKKTSFDNNKKMGIEVGGVSVFENIHGLCKHFFSDASPNKTNKLEVC